MASKFPDEIKILDSIYKILYFDDASDVCIMGRYNVMKEVDFWTNEIRIYKDKSTDCEIWGRIWGSLVSIFIEKLHIQEVLEDEVSERHMELFAMGIDCVLISNKMLNEREKFPDKINIFNSRYDVKYYDKASQVDHVKRKSLFGQVDIWESKIRIYKGKYGETDIWQTIWHEIVHAILDKLLLKLSSDEIFVDLMATSINSVMGSNKILRERFSQTN